MASLANQTISSTYDGLIKTSSDNAVGVSGVTLLEDGAGNSLALSVGRANNGVTVTGSLNATLATAAQPNITSVGTLSSLAVSGNLTVDTDTLFVDASGNKVGIKETSPLGDLHIKSEDTGVASVSAQGSNLVLEGTENGLSILSATAGAGYINFGDSDDNDVGMIIYGHSSNAMSFWTNAGRRMTIDSSGNLELNGSAAPIITVKSTATGTPTAFVYASTNGADFGSLTNHPTRFYVNNSEKMRIASNGRVGIGDSNPDRELNLTLTSDNCVMAIKSGTSRVAGVVLGDSDDDDKGGILYNNASDYLYFSANGSEKMRIASNGNVGINTSTFVNFGANRRVLYVNDSDGAGFATKYADSLAAYMFSNSGATDIVESRNLPMVFYTNNTERMRITSGGFLKASNTGSYISAGASFHELVSSSSSNTALAVHNTATSDPYGIDLAFTGAAPNANSNYFLLCRDSGTNRVIIWSNGNILNSNNSYGGLSDAKLKENIVDASPKLDDLMQVKIRNYNLIGDDKKQIGVVAQELESVFPSMIDESPDFEEQEVIDEEGNVTKERVDLGTTTKSVKYSVFVPMLIKAMQEQQEIINDLKARIETLEAK